MTLCQSSASAGVLIPSSRPMQHCRRPPSCRCLTVHEHPRCPQATRTPACWRRSRTWWHRSRPPACWGCRIWARPLRESGVGAGGSPLRRRGRCCWLRRYTQVCNKCFPRTILFTALWAASRLAWTYGYVQTGRTPAHPTCAHAILCDMFLLCSWQLWALTQPNKQTPSTHVVDDTQSTGFCVG